VHALKIVESPEYTYEDSIEDLRGIVWNSVKDTGKTWADLAADANLSVRTVSRFAYGETKNPAHNTVFALEKALGLRTARVSLGAPRQPDEIAAFALRKYIPSKNEIEGRKAMRRARRRMKRKQKR
jgi:transcriptional regulator with XRE-family HTH domain